jgi:RNA polymerase sigma factor (sigma-70 family)
MSAEGSGDESLFLSRLEDIEQVIRYVCGSHHLSTEEAEDFASQVRIHLIEHDYAVLRKFEGRCQFKTYISIVIERQLLDYRNSVWGKWRPSAAAKRLGDVAILLEQLTVRDGHPYAEACDILHTQHRVEVPTPELDRIAALLPNRMRRRFESDAALEGVPTRERTSDDLAADAGRQAVADRVSDVLNAVMDSLTERDALILALRFEDGCTVGHIAAIVGDDEKRLFRHIDKLLRQLRAELEKAGVDAESVLDVFNNPNVSIDWTERASLHNRALQDPPANAPTIEERGNQRRLSVSREGASE